MSYNQIYDFEACVEGGIKAAFDAVSVTCVTSQESLVQQKARPYVIAEFTLGPGEQKFVVVDPSTGAAPAATTGLWEYRRESCWSCTITLALITESSITSHADYRAHIRHIIGQVWLTINGTSPMTRHKLVIVRDNGNGPLMVNTEGGYMRTDMTYSAKISVQSDAWTALAT